MPVLINGNLGITPKTRKVGTSPFSSILSLISFTVIFETIRKDTTISIPGLFKILQSGSCSRSPISKELHAYTPDSISSVPLKFVSCFHL